MISLTDSQQGAVTCRSEAQIPLAGLRRMEWRAGNADLSRRVSGVFSQIPVLSDCRCGKWEESDIPRPFYGDRQYPLVLGTITRNSPGNDLAAFSGEIPQHSRIFIVNGKATIGTKPTYLPPVICHSTSVICHFSPLHPMYPYLFLHFGLSLLSAGPALPWRQSLSLPPLLSVTMPQGPHRPPA